MSGLNGHSGQNEKAGRQSQVAPGGQNAPVGKESLDDPAGQKGRGKKLKRSSLGIDIYCLFPRSL
jgi:hypothetical protein